jgi:hypothetical protein
MVKWSDGIKLNTTIKQDLKEYIATKCYKYTKRKINNNNL